MNGKYFKYAIGEIFLVIIGILIALSINNWNEGVKQNKERDILLKGIESDLRSDSLEIVNLLTRWEKSEDELELFKARINQPSIPLDSIIYMIKNHLPALINISNGFNDKTYQSLLSTGKLQLIDNPLRDNLFSHYNYQLAAYGRYSVTQEAYINAINAFGNKYAIGSTLIFARPAGKPYSIIWEKIEMQELMQTLNTWGNSKTIFILLSKSEWTRILKNTTLLLETHFKD